MNVIAQQIDYATEELAMLNRILEARDEYRRLSNAVELTKPGVFRSVANEMACNALAHVIRLEREYRDMYAPIDEVINTPADVEPMPDCDETFPRRQPRRAADEIADDPRRWQGDRRTA